VKALKVVSLFPENSVKAVFETAKELTFVLQIIYLL
jgi:hypothetical protein